MLGSIWSSCSIPLISLSFAHLKSSILPTLQQSSASSTVKFLLDRVILNSHTMLGVCKTVKKEASEYAMLICLLIKTARWLLISVFFSQVQVLPCADSLSLMAKALFAQYRLMICLWDVLLTNADVWSKRSNTVIRQVR